jgi:hypothetical protein
VEGDAPRFGRLERLAARDGWANEPADFTPWLAANLQELGEELGLSLTLKAREHPIGRYFLDLLLEDSNERVVIVENQFGQTDHTHLGQLLTYCAGAKAEVVIWIAERLTEEHIAALEWLNDSSVAGVGFFGVELELLRIGDSSMAPHFRVVVKPNEWAKRVRPEPSELIEWGWDAYSSQMRAPAHKLDIARQLTEKVESAVAERDLDLKKVFRKGYIAFQRSGGYNVMTIDFWGYRKVRFSVKLPGPPEDLGIVSPYPTLEVRWIPEWREWGWMIASAAEIPDVVPAVELARRFLSTTTIPAPQASGGDGIG